MNWLSKTFRRQVNSRSLMLGIVEEQFSRKDNLSDHNRWVVETMLQRFSPQAIEELKDELLQLEHQATKLRQPLQFLRAEIMNIVDSSCLNSALMELSEEHRKAISTIGKTFSDEAILGTYVNNEFQIACLRLYCLSKFGDGGTADWFTLYAEAAKEGGKHMANVLCASVGKYDGDPTILTQLHTSYKKAMAELRTKLISTPVGAVFPDKPQKGAEEDRP